MHKEWELKQVEGGNDAKHLSAALNIDIAIANLLVHRGVRTFDEARSFFRPEITHLHDPFLMKEMEKAVWRIQKAVEGNEKVLVFGDYDVDGITSVAMMYTFLKDKVSNIGYYIPDRYTEGYGVSLKGVEFAKENGYSLMIVLDCGIKAVGEVAQANSVGVDVIICDHHTPGDEMPNAVAILNPKQPGCEYPYKELSGCGVAFKLLQAFCIRRDIPEEVFLNFLDLVVVSIASDIVTITGENRVLAYYGLKKLNSDPSVGLKALIIQSGINSRIKINDIVFRIGPRLNASGRIKHGKKSVEMLLAEDEGRATAIGKEIDLCNEARKALDRSITEEAREMLDSCNELQYKKSTVLHKAGWNKGVLGIVASRLTEYYYRPTVVLAESNGVATGSARTVNGFDLYEAIDSCSELLDSYGGHMYAAGLSLKLKHLPEFKIRFEKFVEDNIEKHQLTQRIEVDAKVSLSDLTPKFFRILRQFEPFGPGNMRPVFITEDVMDSGNSRLVGQGNKHLKLDLIEANSSSTVFAGIAFSQSEHFEMIKKSLPFNICYVISENEFRGKSYVQMDVRDIHIRSGQR